MSVEQNDNRIVAQRRDKLQTLKEQNFNFPNHHKPKNNIETIQNQFGSIDEIEDDSIYSIAGRIMAKRVVGKISFCQIQDSTSQLQLFVKRATLGQEAYKEFKKLDIGDIVYTWGQVVRTQTGELSIESQEIVLLTKNLQPLPEKWHGLSDTEQRYRQRYLDLMNNPSVYDSFVLRARLIQSIRHIFEDDGFLEVETPMLHPIPGGASAKPFTTHYNALDHDFYLRIAPELYLKRLIVGGFDKIFEINRNFRNEGLSTRHNPEFTMLEFYEAYATYKNHIDRISELLVHLAQQVNHSNVDTVIQYQEQSIDLAQISIVSVEDLILEQISELNQNNIRDYQSIKNWAINNNVEGFDLEHSDVGQILFAIFEHTIEHTLINPTFVTHHPVSVSPLARPNDNDSFVADRFELYIAGREIANGFSELNDPEEQARRMKEQAQAKEDGLDEFMVYDSDFITALEYGMPPTAGSGIGIDRLMMIFMDAGSIRDSVLFPQLKPKD